MKMSAQWHSWKINKSREVRGKRNCWKTKRSNCSVDPLSFLLFTNFLHTRTQTKHETYFQFGVDIFFCWLILFHSSWSWWHQNSQTIYKYTYIFISFHTLLSYDCLLCFVHCFAHWISGLLFSFMCFLPPRKHRKFICFVCARWIFVGVRVFEGERATWFFDLCCCCFLPRSVSLSLSRCVCDFDLFEWLSKRMIC